MLISDITTARDAFHYAADKIAAGLQPAPRAAATAMTFREIGDAAVDLPLTVADLAAGLKLLAVARAVNEPGNVTGRRVTCGEVAALLMPVPDGGDPGRLAAVFRLVETKFSGSVADRYRAIAATAAREAAELEAAS